MTRLDRLSTTSWKMKVCIQGFVFVFYIRAPVISGWRCEPVTLGKWPLFVLLPWSDYSWHYCLVHCHTLLGKEVSCGLWAVCVFSDESCSEMKLLVEVHIQDNGRRIWDHLLWRRCFHAFEYKSHECFICDFIPFLPFAGSWIHDKSLQMLCSVLSSVILCWAAFKRGSSRDEDRWQHCAKLKPAWFVASYVFTDSVDCFPQHQ